MEEGQREREEMQDIRTMMRYCARKKKNKKGKGSRVSSWGSHGS